MLAADVDSNAAAALSSLNSDALGHAQALFPGQSPNLSVSVLAPAAQQPMHTAPGGLVGLAAAMGESALMSGVWAQQHAYGTLLASDPHCGSNKQLLGKRSRSDAPNCDAEARVDTARGRDDLADRPRGRKQVVAHRRTASWPVRRCGSQPIHPHPGRSPTLPLDTHTPLALPLGHSHSASTAALVSPCPFPRRLIRRGRAVPRPRRTWSTRRRPVMTSQSQTSVATCGPPARTRRC